MIGIISNDLGAYSIIERIKETINYVDIYLYNKEVEDYYLVINKFIDKKCKIIIGDIPVNIKEKYKDICFIYLKNDNTNILSNNDLIQSIEAGNKNKVIEILDRLNINNKKIYISNPIVLFIKDLLIERYNCQIEDSITDLLNSINKVLKEEDVDKSRLGECYFI